MLLPVESNMLECDPNEVLNRMGDPGAHDIVPRFRALEHGPHRLDVIAREPPISLGLQVAHPQLRGQAELDPGHAVRDLPGHELQAPPGRFVVEQDPAHRMHTIRFTIVDRDPMPVDLGYPVGGARVVEGGVLILG